MTTLEMVNVAIAIYAIVWGPRRRRRRRRARNDDGPITLFGGHGRCGDAGCDSGADGGEWDDDGGDFDGGDFGGDFS